MKHKKVIIIEEIFNSITHGIGALVSIFCLILFIIISKDNGTIKIASLIIFGSSMVLAYVMSTLFHSLIFTKAKKVFLVLDSSAIFLLIAGTYTPFLLLLLHGWERICFLLLIWTLAIIGIVLKSVFIDKCKITFLVLYLFCGWLGLLSFRHLMLALNPAEIELLLLGGILYTSGILFYAWKKLPFHHTIWHLFVMSGTFCHFLIIYHL